MNRSCVAGRQHRSMGRCLPDCRTKIEDARLPGICASYVYRGLRHVTNEYNGPLQPTTPCHFRSEHVILVSVFFMMQRVNSTMTPICRMLMMFLVLSFPCPCGTFKRVCFYRCRFGATKAGGGHCATAGEACVATGILYIYIYLDDRAWLKVGYLSILHPNISKPTMVNCGSLGPQSDFWGHCHRCGACDGST